MASPTEKLDRSIHDTERFIIIEQQVLQGSVAMAAAHRKVSKGNPESNARVRQAELGIDQSQARLEFLRSQLEKKKRRRAGLPKVEETRWTNQLDLIRAETPLSVPRISHMLNKLEFKLKLEDQFRQGREKMASALTNSIAKDDRKEKARLAADQEDSREKIKLLKMAAKKYNNLLCDEDEEDEDMSNPANAKEAINRKPISGKLFLSLVSSRDLEHAPLPTSSSSLRSSPKYNNETTVEFKVHSLTKAISHPSRTDRWLQEFTLEMDKADEVEISFYDQQVGAKSGKEEGKRVLIGVMWLKVSDLLEALRRQKVELMGAGEGGEAGWVTAATVRDRDGGSPVRPQPAGIGAVPGAGQRQGGPPGARGGVGKGGASDGIEGWFSVEPQGAVNLKMDFVKENVRRRPLDGTPGGLGRQGAVKKRKGEVHEMNGHAFVKRQFFQVILCALCNKFLMTGDGYQCEDCRYMCHEACYTKVLTKCISKPNSEQEGDEDKINHNIPHRFETYSNMSPNWCCHCGFLLPLGRKIPRKCTECSITCHEQCAHLVPNFCGMPMENANMILGMVRDVKSTKPKRDQQAIGSPARHGKPQQQLQQPLPPSLSQRLPPSTSAPALPASSTQSQPQHPHLHAHSHSFSQTAPPQQPLADRMQGVSISGESRPLPAPQPPAAYQQQQQRMSQQLQQQPYQQPPPKGDRPLPQTPGVNGVPLSVAPPPRSSSSQQIHPSDPYAVKPTSAGPPPPIQQPPFQQQQQQQQQRLPSTSPQITPPAPPQTPPAAPVVPHGTLPLRGKPKKIGLEDFNFLTVLGKGNFGKVMLAEEKTSNQLYAIKVLKKEFIIENDEVDSTKSEKRVFLAAADRRHPFLLNLHSCFQTETRIYFVMEYVSGGDLMLHIQRKQFTTRQAKMYACEVLLALEYFHSKGIIYRDLKLDNILLTVEGHIKVADYGLCKEDMWFGKTTSTFCGTPEFMAPEILMEQRYGRAVDWWAFGVLTYEMLLGQSPFRGDDEDEIFDAILEDPPLYPITMHPNAVMLLQGLLERNPAKRLGGGETDAQEIKRHPFFADVNFDDVYHKRIPPSYFPSLKNPLDTSNFDAEFTNEQPTLTPVHTRLGQKEQEEFQGFSWIANWVGNA